MHIRISQRSPFLLLRATARYGYVASIGSLVQWRSQIGGSLGVQTPPLASKPFFHSRKVTLIKYYNLSLTTRRTINSHNLRKTNHLGRVVRLLHGRMRLDLDPGAIFGCNIAKWTILCIVVHFQPVIKLLHKCVSRTDTNPPFAFQTSFPRETDFSVPTGRVKKLHTLFVSLYF